MPLSGTIEHRRLGETEERFGRQCLCFASSSIDYSRPVKITLLWAIEYGSAADFQYTGVLADPPLPAGMDSFGITARTRGWDRTFRWEPIPSNKVADLVEETPIPPPRKSKNYSWRWDAGQWRKRWN